MYSPSFELRRRGGWSPLTRETRLRARTFSYCCTACIRREKMPLDASKKVTLQKCTATQTLLTARETIKGLDETNGYDEKFDCKEIRAA